MVLLRFDSQQNRGRRKKKKYGNRKSRLNRIIQHVHNFKIGHLKLNKTIGIACVPMIQATVESRRPNKISRKRNPKLS